MNFLINDAEELCNDAHFYLCTGLANSRIDGCFFRYSTGSVLMNLKLGALKSKDGFQGFYRAKQSKNRRIFFFSNLFLFFFSLLSSPPAPNEAFWEGKWRRARYELCVYIFFSGYDGALSLEVLTKIIGFVWKKLGWINGWSKG